MGPKWVIFDAADTLLRPVPQVASVYQQVAAEHGSQLTTDDIADRIAPAIRKYFAGEVSSEELDYRRWRELVFDVLDTSDEVIFNTLWNYFAKASSWQLHEDVLTAWNWLEHNGFRLAIASNFDQRLLNIVRALPPIHSAEYVFISSELGFRKPSSFFFRAIERELDERADELMLIGNSRHADFEGGQNAGWQTLHLDRLSEYDRFPTICRLTSIIQHLRPHAQQR